MASVEIYAHGGEGPVRRLTLVIGEPTRVEDGAGWTCRAALADLHGPREITGSDSVEVLARAVALARSWMGALEAEGHVLFRDRAGTRPYSLE
jgi:hypothetical protein